MKKRRCFFCQQSVRRRIAPCFAAMRSGLFTHLSTASVDASRTSQQNKHLARALHSAVSIPKTSYTLCHNTSSPATYTGDELIPIFLKRVAHSTTPPRRQLFVHVRARRSKGMDSARTPIYAQPSAPRRAPALRRLAAPTRNAQVIEKQDISAPATLPGNPRQGALQRASRPSSRACQQTCPQFLGMTRKSLVLATTWRAQFTGMTA
ncbi:MAG: hypothetical protein IJM64_03325 [Ottowia sp.]|nr:hypothetical protein [Ottowia sp.]